MDLQRCRLSVCSKPRLVPSTVVHQLEIQIPTTSPSWSLGEHGLTTHLTCLNCSIFSSAATLVKSSETSCHTLLGLMEPDLRQLAVDLGQVTRGSSSMTSCTRTGPSESRRLHTVFMEALVGAGWSFGRSLVHHAVTATDYTTKILYKNLKHDQPPGATCVESTNLNLHDLPVPLASNYGSTYLMDARSVRILSILQYFPTT